MSVTLPSWEKVPAYYYQSPESAAILDATTAQALAAAEVYEDLKLQLYPLTATWSLPLWEAAVGLVSDSDTPIEQRRAAVCARLVALPVTNEETIRALVSSLTGLRCRTVVLHADYTFTVEFLGDEPGWAEVDRDEVNAAVEPLKPAHLRFLLPGMTWADVEAMGVTWARVEAANTTWADVERRVPVHVES